MDLVATRPRLRFRGGHRHNRGPSFLTLLMMLLIQKAKIATPRRFS
jgi:hypothetical protein